MRRIVAFVTAVLVLLLAGDVFAQANVTRRLRCPYTNSDPMNQCLDKIDANAAGPDSAAFVTYCSQQANAGTTFMASVTAANNPLMNGDPYARTVGDATCDGRGSATEATADEILSSQVSVRVTGMCCAVETTPGALVTFTLRNAVADTSPLISCSIAAGGPLSCCTQSPLAASPTIPAGTTVAVKAVDTTNESAVGGLCRVFIRPFGN